DRLGIAEMAVGADHAGHDIADRHAILHLGNGGRIMLAKNLERRVLEAFVLRAQVRDLGFRSLRLARQMLLARRIAIETPGGLAAALADPRIRIDAGRKAKLPGTLLIGIGPPHEESSC